MSNLNKSEKNLADRLGFVHAYHSNSWNYLLHMMMFPVFHAAFLAILLLQPGLYIPAHIMIVGMCVFYFTWDYVVFFFFFFFFFFFSPINSQVFFFFLCCCFGYWRCVILFMYDMIYVSFVCCVIMD